MKQITQIFSGAEIPILSLKGSSMWKKIKVDRKTTARSYEKDFP